MNGRYTVQRQLVLEAVQRLYHPTADDVYGMIAQGHPNVSRATVYRNLSVLADTGHIRRVQLLDAAIRFDGRMTEHFHAQCRECGLVLDVMEEGCLSGLGTSLAGQGFMVTDREVLLRGICAACRDKKGEAVVQKSAFHG